jgi:hypothetical protein
MAVPIGNCDRPTLRSAGPRPTLRTVPVTRRTCHKPFPGFGLRAAGGPFAERSGNFSIAGCYQPEGGRRITGRAER